MDFDFAKEQLLLMLRSLYFHPNGQIPAYEWNFSDVNPPVHAWATLYLYKMERALGRADIRFLERAFQALMLNFNWWVNRKDPPGRNVFAGGFLGLDNIGVFDRSAPAAHGRHTGAGRRDRVDGVLLPVHAGDGADPLPSTTPCTRRSPSSSSSISCGSRTRWTASASSQDEMWDEEDGFFYDVLRLPDGNATRLKVRSMVGLLPLCASPSSRPTP